MRRYRIVVAIGFFVVGMGAAEAQGNSRGNSRGERGASSDRSGNADRHAELEGRAWTHGLDLRCVGPTVMSGRVVDVAVHPEAGGEFYVAYASGGLWHTVNHGTSFEPIFDHENVMTLGSVSVSWEEGRIWVGTGEVNSSRSSYAGTGVYWSDDGGENWVDAGLDGVDHIGRIIADPHDPEVAWVAALGPLYSENKSGGVYKTEDGGASWVESLVVPGDHGRAGAVDLIQDKKDPEHLIASIWDRTRRAWEFTENGSGTGVFETFDAGTTWTSISNAPGFPESPWAGRVGIAYHDESGHLFALVDNQTPLPDEEKEEGDGEEEMEAIEFKEMTPNEFAALDSARLGTYLEENDFPDEATVDYVKGEVAEGSLFPRAFYDYLSDGNSDLFDASIHGVEVYRFDIAGNSWERTHEEALEDVSYTYGYYFGLIEVDPLDPNHLFIAGVPLLESVDGGANWEHIGGANVHVDHHSLYVNPTVPGHLINGNDGGINISWDYGEHWVKCNTPAVGQFYAVAVDEADPYRIYGGLQDNGTWVGPSDYEASLRWEQTGRYDYESLGGGDGMQIAIDTRTNETVITGYQFGWYNRKNRTTGERESIHPKHELGETPLRWNWQTPILLSRHNQDVLYMGSSRFHRSLDQGTTFETLSDDLTRGGRPGNVPFGTLTTIHESPLRFGQLAVGTDDGLIHVSRDGGYNWTALPSPVKQGADQRLWVPEVRWSHHERNRLFVVLNGYRNDDFTSYIFMTENAGRSWERLGTDLPMEPVNALCESADSRGLLFIGTDNGAYVSFDNGAAFSTVHPDLPRAPVHDLVIQERENDLVIGTHGRSIWILELSTLLDRGMDHGQPLTLFPPDDKEWDEDWGERGWAWSEPREVELRVDAFSPEEAEATWDIRDSSGVVWSSGEWELKRGIQELTLSLANEAGDYLTPGIYTVTLESGEFDAAIRAETPFVVTEEED